MSVAICAFIWSRKRAVNVTTKTQLIIMECKFEGAVHSWKGRGMWDYDVADGTSLPLSFCRVPLHHCPLSSGASDFQALFASQH